MLTLRSHSVVFVHDPTDAEVIPVGKQANNPSHIFYRPCSGIWQPVWIEGVPSDYATQFDVAAAADGKGMLLLPPPPTATVAQSDTGGFN